MSKSEDRATRDKYGYGSQSSRDESPTGSKQTRGSGGTGRIVGATVRGEMDGNGMEIGGQKRSWDTGAEVGYTGTKIAYAKGRADQQPTDARFQNPSGKGMPGAGKYGGGGPKAFPEPSTKEDPTIAKRFEGQSGGFGPKVRQSSTGGDVQKGKTGSRDDSPKGRGKESPGVTGGKSYKGGGSGY